jgi:hypothetical protein
MVLDSNQRAFEGPDLQSGGFNHSPNHPNCGASATSLTPPKHSVTQGTRQGAMIQVNPVGYRPTVLLIGCFAELSFPQPNDRVCLPTNRIARARLNSRSERIISTITS